MAEYKFGKRAKACSLTGEPFAPGDVIVSAIYEEGEGFARQDVREDHFDRGSRPFCFWRSRQSQEAEKKQLDYDLALGFLDKLLRDADPRREGLVYALTLLLNRKRRVKIKETRRLSQGELLRVAMPRAEDDEVVSVRAPRLTDEQVPR